MERVALAEQAALPPGPVAARIERFCAEIAERTGAMGRRVELDWVEVLLLRTRMLGLRPLGRISANGTCRLLRAGDGSWLALSLGRPDDLESVEALADRRAVDDRSADDRPGDDRSGGDPWAVVEEVVGKAPAAEFVERARLVGMPAALLGSVAPPAWPWEETRVWPEQLAPATLVGMTVVDLSSLWAGPLVAKVLSEAGARVIKVESTARRDGARATPAFYEWLHAPDQPEAVIDFASEDGRRKLFELLDGADVVVEASRPRALEQLCCDPDRMSSRPGRVWLSITGYGRESPGRDWVAFGDDAAVAGGLVAWEAGAGASPAPVFCGDAIADPLTGLVGAVAILRSIESGGGRLIDAAMARAAAYCAYPYRAST